MKRNGFTLVELSIVLVIIGLLIGGILVAQSMIDTARAQKVVQELQQYQVMVNNFGTKYNSLPGDASVFTPAGNNDGIIWNGIDSPINYRFESAAFWQHLKSAAMLLNCACSLAAYQTQTTPLQLPPTPKTQDGRWVGKQLGFIFLTRILRLII